MKYLLATLILIITLSTNAEIITDGTLGQQINLPGNNFQITPDLGQQHGGNLFHSFQDFNLNSSESAIFSGPNSVQNIISRVTGGNPSNIDGLIRSKIPNADMYFLNPYGIMFGPNAKLDVQGSFHASTADYLRLGTEGRFDVRNPNDSLLTVASVESFGFLTDNPASINTQNSNLSVPETQTLSLIGGDINLTGNSSIKFDEQGFMAISARSKLFAGNGRINLASVASKGEINETELDLNTDGGTITANNTLIDVSGRGSGSIFIRGGKLIMQDATVQANTKANQNGKIIDIKLTENIKIAGNVSAILSKTFGQGDSGQIVIIAPNLEVTESLINTSSLAEGDARDIKIAVNKLELKQGSSISSRNYAGGKGGNIEIQATEKTSLLGKRTNNYQLDGLLFQQYPTIINSTAIGHGQGGKVALVTGHLEIEEGMVATASLGKGNSGDLKIDANTATFSQGGFINTNGMVAGRSGNIELTVKNMLLITGKRPGFYITPSGMIFEDNQSGISTLTLGTEGQAGNIIVSAGKLKLENDGIITASNLGGSKTIGGNIVIIAENLLTTEGGQINNSNGIFMGKAFISGLGKGGNITINAKNISIVGRNEDDHQTGIFSDTFNSKQGGNIEIHTNNLNIKQQGNLSAHSHGNGNAGEITVQADTVSLTSNGNISTSAINATGGNININTSKLLYLSKNGNIVTSVNGGDGNGGNINIKNLNSLVLSNSYIKAQADSGNGGNIQIKSGQFITSPNSLINASSNLGLDGEVKINSPNINMEGFLVVLSDEILEASNLMKKSCNKRLAENLSKFIVKPSEGSYSSPDDLLPSGILLSDNLPVKKAVYAKNSEDKLAISTCKYFEQDLTD